MVTSSNSRVKQVLSDLVDLKFQKDLTLMKLFLVLLLTLGNKQAGKTAAPVLSQAEIRKIRQETEQGVKVDGIVISKHELDRIKRSTKVTTKEQDLENKKLLSE